MVSYQCTKVIPNRLENPENDTFLLLSDYRTLHFYHFHKIYSDTQEIKTFKKDPKKNRCEPYYFKPDFEVTIRDEISEETLPSGITEFLISTKS